MHIPLWTTLLYAARHNGPALVERTSPVDICLPAQLQTAVPTCAYQCLQTFIADNYNLQTCTSTADINLLCINPTTSGLTIGEGSLQCVLSSCLGADIETQSGYTVCEGIIGALPNMAETITATVSAISTLLPSVETSAPSATGTLDASSTSDIPSSTTSSQALETSQPVATASLTTSAFSITSTSSPSSTSETVSVSSTIASGSATASQSSSDVSDGSSATTLSSSIIATSSSATRTSVSISSASRSATSSATAAAATEGATESKLGTSAIAGIVTAVVLVVALILGFLAYWLCVRRKEKKRRTQHFTEISMPPNGDNFAGTEFVTQNGQGGLFNNPARRFYSRETSRNNQSSFWRRSAVPPNDIGVAIAPSTRVSPERQNDITNPTQAYKSLPSPALAMQIDSVGPAANASRWSLANSFDEDIEAQAQAQNQDLPALASPRTRASSRSFSSVGVDRPAPLQLNKKKQLPDVPAQAIIPLTPVYDNGTFEPTIRQVIEQPSQPAGLVRLSRERQAPNFSRREPSLTRTSQDDGRPIALPAQRSNQMNRFPVKPVIPPRKQSETTDRSMSVHTEFEEDSTPEDEDDKQLSPPRQAPLPARVPLKEIQYPQIPRPAATRKQAQNPHSPRALTIRRVDPGLDPYPPQKSFAERARTAPRNPDLTQINVSSTSSVYSGSSESPIFPTPPPRNPARKGPAQAQPSLRSEIIDAYRIASRPVTTTTSATASSIRNSEYPPSAYPGAARFGAEYDSPSLQRLSAGKDRGRPLAQRLQAQGYMPRPPLRRETPKAMLNPQNMSRSMHPRDGDLYF